jgi:ABC-type dipeptide/oligopeptide/nickel transport system permease component
MLKYVARRLLVLVVQVWALTSLIFVLVQVLPGDPLYLLVDQTASTEQIEQTRKHLRLDRPLHERYLQYYWNLSHGDLGTSFFSAASVSDELMRRVPATFELVLYSFVFSILIGATIGSLSAYRPSGGTEKWTFYYGMVAGALPEFWWGLVLIMLLFDRLGLVAAPIGRLDIDVSEPSAITGLLTVDSLLSGNWAALRSSASHLFLPVLTLVLLQTASVLKVTRFQMLTAMHAAFVHYARACGLSPFMVFRYAFRSALPPIVTHWAIIWAYLMGGVVLVEALFSWGGIGQYVVQAVASADFVATTGAVLVLTLWSLLIYLALDVILAVIDPRVRY